MKKKEICAISDLNHLNGQQYVSTLQEFVGSHCSDPFFLTSMQDFDPNNMDNYKKLVTDSQKWKSLTEVVQVKPEYLLLCFDGNSKFVCMRDQVRFSNHRVSLPEHLLSFSTHSSLSFTDRCALLYQCSVSDENGLVELPWQHLCIPQMLSVAQYLGLGLTFRYV